MNFWTNVLVLGVAAFFAILWMRAILRTRALHKMAVEFGSIENHDIPASLSFRNTGLAGTTAAWNKFWGKRRGTDIVVFDCRMGSGKGAWRRTVIASYGLGEVLGAKKFDPDLMVEQAGEWTILYRLKEISLVHSGLMSVEEIRAHLASF